MQRSGLQARSGCCRCARVSSLQGIESGPYLAPMRTIRRRSTAGRNLPLHPCQLPSPRIQLQRLKNLLRPSMARRLWSSRPLMHLVTQSMTHRLRSKRRLKHLLRRSPNRKLRPSLHRQSEHFRFLLRARRWHRNPRLRERLRVSRGQAGGLIPQFSREFQRQHRAAE